MSVQIENNFGLLLYHVSVQIENNFGDVIVIISCECAD